MNILGMIFAIVWIYVLSILNRGKLDFWKFCWGSVGLFILMVVWIQPLVTIPLSKAVASVAGIVGDLTGIYSSYFQYGILFIMHGGSSISMYIDYECSGVIEIMAFSALLWFFPLYSISEKTVFNVLGFLWIFIANVFRIFIICVLIYFYGNSIFYFAHTIFGRLVFYCFSVVLYFYVFTKPHIRRQKVGNFSYGIT